MKITNKLGERMSPCTVPVPSSIGSVTAKFSLIQVTAFVYSIAIAGVPCHAKPGKRRLRQ